MAIIRRLNRSIGSPPPHSRSPTALTVTALYHINLLSPTATLPPRQYNPQSLQVAGFILNVTVIRPPPILLSPTPLPTLWKAAGAIILLLPSNSTLADSQLQSVLDARELQNAESNGIEPGAPGHFYPTCRLASSLAQRIDHDLLSVGRPKGFYNREGSSSVESSLIN